MIPRHFQIAIGFLLLAILIVGISLTRVPEQPTATQGQSPAAPALAAKPEQIQLLVAYDDDQALRWRQTEALMSPPEDRSQRAREAIRALLAQYLQSPSPHAIGKGSDVRDVYWIGQDQGRHESDTLVIDMTTQFADGHPSGVLAEQFTVTSVIETVNANVRGVAKVKFLINGQERETLAGHADLMSFYQTAAMHELARQFE